MSLRVAIGFRAHTGWAAGVALVGPADAPSVIDRRRVALSTLTETVAMQSYHAAAEQPFAKAEVMIEQAVAATNAASRESIDAWIAALGRPIKRAGLVAGNQAMPDSLERVLASHSLIHAAEGEMFRAAIVRACEATGVTVLGVPGNSLFERGGELLGLTAGKLRDRLDALGVGLGAPWGKDQKEAALVAWLALVGR